jgi:hypothetical protein
VYLADLDKVASLTNHMTMVGTVGPFSLGSGLSNIRFLPVKTTASSIGGVSVQSGFIVYDAGTNESLLFASGSGNNPGSNQQFSLAGANPNYPLYEYDVTNTINNQASIVVFRWDPATTISTTTSSFQQFVATLPSGSLTPVQLPPPPSLLSTVFTGNVLIGGSILPAPPPTYDTFAFLGASSTGFSTGSSQMNGSTTTFNYSVVPAPASVAIPSPPLRSLYYFSVATGASYASFYSGGQWTCLQWSSTGAAYVMSGVLHRIDAVLSTGDLLSTEGGTLRLYDPNGTGTEVLSVPLNGLQFCYEAYVGTAPYVFFSLPVSVQHNQWVFNVYALPSSAMRGLGK